MILFPSPQTWMKLSQEKSHYILQEKAMELGGFLITKLSVFGWNKVQDQANNFRIKSKSNLD